MLAPPSGQQLHDQLEAWFRELLGVDELLVADVEGQWRWAFKRLATLSLGPVVGELVEASIDAQWTLVERNAFAEMA